MEDFLQKGENMKENKINIIEKAVENIIEAIGEEKNREGLKDTPKRVATSYLELFSGVLEDEKEPLKKAFEIDDNNLVIEKGIDFYSMCEHHFIPFFGKIDIAYIPNGKIVGFGDIIKVIEILSKRPQIQERLCNQIAQTIYETLNCQGVYVKIEGKHLCMTMRGSKKENSKIVTTCCKGIFKNDTMRCIEVLNLFK